MANHPDLPLACSPLAVLLHTQLCTGVMSNRYIAAGNHIYSLSMPLRSGKPAQLSYVWNNLASV